MAITPLPTPVPNSTMSEGVFDEAADNFLGALPDFATEANALASDVNAKASTATGAASTATTKAGEAAGSAIAAAASANSAAATAGADVHVPNAAYTVSNPASAVVSNVNGQTYRCIVSHSGVATDPANDATNWVRITFNGAYADLSGKPSLGTAASKNTGTTSGAVPLLGEGGKIPASMLPPPQSVSSLKTNTASTNSESYVDTGISVSITLTDAANQVDLRAFVSVGTAGVDKSAFFRFVRGATVLALGDASGSLVQSAFSGATDDWATTSAVGGIVDAPGSIGPHTYKLQWRTGNSDEAIYINRPSVEGTRRPSNISTLTALEVS